MQTSFGPGYRCPARNPRSTTFNSGKWPIARAVISLDAPGNTAFNRYFAPVAAYGLGLNEWRGSFPDDNGSAPPNVMCNPTDTPITVSDTTWLPHQVTFHPGQQDERSVIRWTSPFNGPAHLAAVF